MRQLLRAWLEDPYVGVGTSATNFEEDEGDDVNADDSSMKDEFKLDESTCLILMNL